jgi:hypothetical protein
MSHPNRRHLPIALILASLALAGCASQGPVPPPAPAVAPMLPPAFPPQDIVGRWGLAAYHREEDRDRTVAAAANQCQQPYVITLGPTGGVMMHLADQSTPSELRLKGGPDGKTYIGPEGEAGGMQDREVVSFDGRVLILRWMDPDVQSRYGTMVYVRCGPEGARRPAQVRAKPRHKPRPKPRPKPKPKPKPAPRPTVEPAPPASSPPPPPPPPPQQQ